MPPGLLCYYPRAFERGLAQWLHVMVAPVGFLATIRREPGQARKGAATVADLGAGVWLAGVASNFIRLLYLPAHFRDALLTLSQRSCYRYPN